MPQIFSEWSGSMVLLDSFAPADPRAPNGPAPQLVPAMAIVDRLLLELALELREALTHSHLTLPLDGGAGER